MRKSLEGALLLGVLVLCASCATKSQQGETPVVAFVDSMTIPVEYEHAWKLTRDVLLEQEGIEIYTRDKRGVFVAYTQMYREKVIYPKRTMLTITLEAESKTSTKIAVETVAQRYRVTPLTYPGWQDAEEVSEEEVGREILDSIKSRISTN